MLGHEGVEGLGNEEMKFWIMSWKKMGLADNTQLNIIVTNCSVISIKFK